MNIEIILLSILICNITILILIFLLAIKASRALFLLKTRVLTEVSSIVEGKPSQFATFINTLTAALAHQLTVSIKNSWAGIMSATSRGEKIIQGEIMKQNAPPLLQSLMETNPKISRTMTKNPILGLIASSLLSKFTGQQPQVEQAAVGGNNHEEKMDLKS